MLEMQSTDIKELAVSLTKVQSEMEIAEKKKNNPFFKSKYADFQAVVEASRPAMVNNGLCITQIITEKEDGTYLVSMLMHSSGQFLRSVKKITPLKNDIQSFASYVTYCKRLCYSALLGVVCADEDDDGEQAVAPHRNNKQAPVPAEEKITSEQLEQLWFELEDQEELTKSILKAFNIKELSEMPKSQFLRVISRIQEVKNVHNQRS